MANDRPPSGDEGTNGTNGNDGDNQDDAAHAEPAGQHGNDDNRDRRREDDDTEQFPRQPGPDDGYDARYAGDGGDEVFDTYDEVPPYFSEDEFAGVRGEQMPPPFSSTRRVLPLEDEPSSIVAKYLFPTEKFRGEWKHHWVQLLKEMGVGLGITLIMGYATGYLAKHNMRGLLTGVLIIWAAVMFWVVWRVADWYFDRFILTNKRVMVVKGLITRNVGMMPLLRVTDMKYVQSPLGRVFNYGTFELESAGQDQALSKIKNLPNPNELYLRIVEEMYEPEAVEARLGRAAAESEDGSGT